MDAAETARTARGHPKGKGAQDQPPILVLYASAGGGHRSAALAVAEALPGAGWEGPVEVLDLLANVPFWMRWAYSELYLWLVRYMPYLWSWGYEHWEDLSRFEADGPLVRSMRAWTCRRFAERLLSRRPAAIVSTHFTCADIVSDLKAEGRLDCWASSVVTDFAIHTIWLQSGMDAFCVASERSRHELQAVAPKIGLDPGAVHHTGVPIRGIFNTPPDVAGVRRRLGLREEARCLVVMAGSRDRWTAVRLLEQLARITLPLDVLVISGRNRRIAPAVAGYAGHPTMKVHDLGMIDFIGDLFGVADLVITKAGGSTVSECLARGLPLVVFRPYKGQEERNSDWLLERGAAIRLIQFEGMSGILEDLLTDQGRLEGLRAACRSSARPDAAFQVARITLDGVRGKGY